MGGGSERGNEKGREEVNEFVSERVCLCPDLILCLYKNQKIYKYIFNMSSQFDFITFYSTDFHVDHSPSNQLSTHEIFV